MKHLNQLSLVVVIFLIFSTQNFSQQTSFDINAYRTFLQNHQNATSSDLLQEYPAGLFVRNLNQSLDNVLYLDTIYQKYNFTEYEKQLLQQNGFVVTERLSMPSYGGALANIFHLDLPVYVSTDAILHAIHMSYDALLMDIEGEILIPRLTELLNQFSLHQPILHNRYSNVPGMQICLEDYDVYITLAKKLLGMNVTPYYTINNSRINELIENINNEAFMFEYSIFGEPEHTVDFSQFKPRGHYADPENLLRYPFLEKYFKAMIWLGRTEVYLASPGYNNLIHSTAVQRSVILASLISEAAKESNAKSIYNEMNSIIEFLVGDQDNVNLSNMEDLFLLTNITSSSQLLDSLKLFEFQDSLLLRPFAYQLINSQLLMSNPFITDSIIPASAFMLMGQRFIIDSYITAQVVYDRIVYNGQKVRRMLPSTLDVLFGLGNDASAQLLKPELDQWNYSTNLMGLRYLIDGYDENFWNENLFNKWLRGLRKLNPPPQSERENLPLFMQSAAYWQQKMNTQLTGWTQLRHDNVLYAKQSYTSGWICSYPYSYVEPFPEFYSNFSSYAQKLHEIITPLQFSSSYVKESILHYANNLKGVCDTLAIIAEKELGGIALSEAEIFFLKGMLRYTNSGYGSLYDGWYFKLFLYSDNHFQKEDLITVDIHTSGMNESGNVVGWVKHSGTGKVNMGLFVAPDANGQSIAFIGPVGSYHEFTTTNFLRLTDEEWKTTYLAQSSRPDWVNSYLANGEGESRGSGASLLTSTEDSNPIIQNEKDWVVHQNYPNPFNASTLIQFRIPTMKSLSNTSLDIFDIQGRRVKQLINEVLSSGNYVVRWDGTNQTNELLPSGIYFYRLSNNGYKSIGKMLMIK
jgi:hypothetical protein